MKKIILFIVGYVLLAALIIPFVVTLVWTDKRQEENHREVQNGIENLLEPEAETPDFVTDGQVVQAVPEKLPDGFEEYIQGVVSAEMPALFQIEALKSQAVAARTYAVRKMLEMDNWEVPYEIGQAYLSLEERKKKWGSHFEQYEEKIAQAVKSTEGEIMIYEQQPILAVFHGESAGRTENSENVWEQSIPYLKSVDSSGDKKAPDFEKDMVFSCQEVVQAFQKKSPALTLDAAQLEKQLKIVERSDAGYILKIQVGSELWTGREVREALGLRSANFTYHQEGDTICFTTKGNGHGAGMSQYGAEFMAQDGRNYKEILFHYYSGVEIKKMK